MSGRNIAESFRDVVQDLLVPELKAVKVSVESLSHQMDSLRTEMKLRDEKMEQLIRSGDARLEAMIQSGDERNVRALQALSEKLDFAIDIRERLATLEARQPRQ